MIKIIGLKIEWSCVACASNKITIGPATNLRVLKSGIEEPPKCLCGDGKYVILSLAQVDYSGGEE